MKTRQEISSALVRVQALVALEQQRQPADTRFQILARELKRVEERVAASWPLPADFAADLRFGLFAVRELEDLPNLSDRLCELDQMLKQRGA